MGAKCDLEVWGSCLPGGDVVDDEVLVKVGGATGGDVVDDEVLVELGRAFGVTGLVVLLELD